MELTYCTFLPINNRPTAINRATYAAVYEMYDQHQFNGQMQFSALELCICLTRRGVPDLRLSLDDLSKVVKRLPVSILCGGYAAGSKLKKGDSLNLRYLPAPVTPAHLDRLIIFLQNMADYHGMSLVGLDKLKDQHALFITAALKKKFIRIVEPTSMMGLAQDDCDSVQAVVMGDSSNEHLLASTLFGWLDIELFAPTQIAIDSLTHDVVIHDTEYIYPNVIRSVDVFKKQVAMPAVLNSIQTTKLADQKAMIEQGKFARNVQTRVDLLGLKINLTVTMVKLMDILDIISVYYKMTIKEWCNGARVLDLCSDPGNMSLLMSSFGAAVEAQTSISSPVWAASSSVIRASCVLPRLDLADFRLNVTENAALHSYSFVIADGHVEENGSQTDQITLFWAQLHAAVRLVGVGGSVIIKATNSIVDLWDGLGPLGKDMPNHEISNNLVDSWSKFNHWAVIKPLGSRFYSSEVYWCFFGYRAAPKQLDRLTIFNHLIVAQNRIRAKRDKNFARDSDIKAVVDIPVPTLTGFLANSFTTQPAGPAIGKSDDYKKVITENLVPGKLLYPKPLEAVITLWNANFKKDAVMHYARSVLPIKVPDEVNSISINTLNQSVLDIMDYYMRWLIEPPSRLNHKAFVLEYVQRLHVVIKYETSFKSTGEPHKPLWVCVLKLHVKHSDVSWLQDILSEFTARSRGFATRKDAEQDAYRQVIECLTKCRICWVKTDESSRALQFDTDVSVLIQNIRKAKVMSYDELVKILPYSLSGMSKSDLYDVLKADYTLAGFTDDVIYFNAKLAGIEPTFCVGITDWDRLVYDADLAIKYAKMRSKVTSEELIRFVKAVTTRSVDSDSLRGLFSINTDDGSFAVQENYYDNFLAPKLVSFITKSN
jgi:hypothetical protein